MVATRTLKSGGGSYDRMQALRDGRVTVPGYTLDMQVRDVGKTAHDAFHTGELDIAETSIGEFLLYLEGGGQDYVGLPVYPSIAFRHDTLYVRKDSNIRAASDLTGRRIGCTMLLSTTGIWVRGMLQDQFGLGLKDVTWVSGGLDKPQALKIPESNLSAEPARTGASLIDMLEAGEIDAIQSYRVPDQYKSGGLRRLFNELEICESDYYSRTRALPLLHMLVLRRSLVDADPALPAALIEAFTKSKDMALAALRETACYAASLPFLAQAVDRAERLLGHDFWPYGYEQTGPSVDVFIRYCVEQGLIRSPRPASSLFAR